MDTEIAMNILEKKVVFMRTNASQWLRDIHCNDIDLVKSILECLWHDFIFERYGFEIEDLMKRISLSRLYENSRIKTFK